MTSPHTLQKPPLSHFVHNCRFVWVLQNPLQTRDSVVFEPSAHIPAVVTMVDDSGAETLAQLPLELLNSKHIYTSPRNVLGFETDKTIKIYLIGKNHKLYDLDGNSKDYETIGAARRDCAVPLWKLGPIAAL